jgi:hypothetical protein
MPPDVIVQLTDGRAFVHGRSLRPERKPCYARRGFFFSGESRRTAALFQSCSKSLEEASVVGGSDSKHQPRASGSSRASDHQRNASLPRACASLDSRLETPPR